MTPLRVSLTKELNRVPRGQTFRITSFALSVTWVKMYLLSNVIDAAAGGAASGLQLALNVGAMLIAFVGLIALINGMLGGIGGWFVFGASWTFGFSTTTRCS